MEIYFSRHARRQMKWRRISDDEIKTAIASADRREESMRGRKNAFKKMDKRLLKVTYVEEIDRIVVITAVDKID